MKSISSKNSRQRNITSSRKGTKSCSKPQYKRNLKPINNTLEREDREDVRDAAASPSVPATEDWYNFKEEEDYEFYNALETHMPDVGANSKDEVTIIREEDDWLSEEIKNEVRKQEKLAQQLDEVVKPEASQEMEQLCWRLKAQQTGSSGGELEPEKAEDKYNAIETPPDIPKSATVETPEQKASDIISPEQPPPV